MAKRYDRADFQHVLRLGSDKPVVLPRANDEVARIQVPREPPLQKGAYLESYLKTEFANDEIAELNKRSKALMHEFGELAIRRNNLSPSLYHHLRKHLLKVGILSLCRDPGCSASPTHSQPPSLDGLAKRLADQTGAKTPEQREQKTRDTGLER